MEIKDYNGHGRWSHSQIISRYARYAADAGVLPRDLSPINRTLHGRRWVYPAMQNVIAGIEANDLACIQIGIEFIEEDAKFPFGKTLKSNTARALRRAPLSDEQKRRIRHRIFGMLKAGHIPHEYREYAKLVRKIGFEVSEIPETSTSNVYVTRFRTYFETAARAGT